MVDEDARTLPLSGLALSIFVVSIFCLVLSVIAVAIRTHVRCSEKTFGFDDILILAGLVSPTRYGAILCIQQRLG